MATYYVGKDGSDNNDGLAPESAFLTLSKVQSTSLNPGDQILLKRGDTWTGEQLSISASGSSGSPIVFGAYGTGARPIIDGNNSLSDYLFRITSNTAYITIQDIEFKRLNMAGGGSFRGAIQLQQRANNIKILRCVLSCNTANTQIWTGGLISALDPHTILIDECDLSGTHYGFFLLCNYNNSHNDTYGLTFTNNYFHDFDPRPVDTNAALRGRGIAMMTWWDTDPDAPGDGSTPGTTFGDEGTIRDVLIDNNTFERILSNCIDWYWHYNFVTTGTKGYNWTITNNTVRDVAFNFVDLAPIGNRGGSVNKSIFARNDIRRSGWDWLTNELYNIPGEGFVNVVQTHVWDNWIIEDNIIIDVGQTEGDGAGIILDYSISATLYKCEYLTIRNNFIKGCLAGTGEPGATAGQGINNFTGKNCDIYNNIIVECNIGVMVTNQSEDTLIFNNTLNNNEFGIYSGGDTNTVIRNNIISNNGTGIRVGGTQPGFSTDYNLRFNNTSTGATGSNDVVGDPKFLTASDLRLQPDSPAIDAGTTVTQHTSETRNSDFAGNPIVDAADIGAYEFVELNVTYYNSIPVYDITEETLGLTIELEEYEPPEVINNEAVVDFNFGAAGTVAEPGTGLLQAVGFAATVIITANVIVQPGTGEVQAAGFAPTVIASNHITVEPQTGQAVLEGFAPAVLTSDNKIVLPGTGEALLSGFAPAVTTGNDRIVQAGTGQLIATGFAPAVNVTDHKTVLPGVGQLTASGFAPVVVSSNHIKAEPGTGQLIATGLVPAVNVSDHKIILPGAGALILTGFSPAITVGDSKVVQPGTGELTVSGLSPVIVLTDHKKIFPGTGELIITGLAPIIQVSDHKIVLPGTGELIVKGFVPAVVLSDHKKVIPGIGELIITGFSPVQVIGTELILASRIDTELFLKNKIAAELILKSRVK